MAITKEPLTVRELERYLDAGGAYCPYCQSREGFHSEGFTGEGGAIWWPFTCLTCGGSWKDCYQLTGIEYRDEGKIFSHHRQVLTWKEAALWKRAQEVIKRLLTWLVTMGGWDAKVWRQAERLHHAIQERRATRE